MCLHPVTRAVSPVSVMFVQPCRPSSSKLGQFLERDFRRVSVTKRQPARWRVFRSWQPLVMDDNPLSVSFLQ